MFPVDHARSVTVMGWPEGLQVIDISLRAIDVHMLCQGPRLRWRVLTHNGRVFSTLPVHGLVKRCG